MYNNFNTYFFRSYGVNVAAYLVNFLRTLASSRSTLARSCSYVFYKPYTYRQFEPFSAYDRTRASSPLFSSRSPAPARAIDRTVRAKRTNHRDHRRAVKQSSFTSLACARRRVVVAHLIRTIPHVLHEHRQAAHATEKRRHGSSSASGVRARDSNVFTAPRVRHTLARERHSHADAEDGDG